MFLITTILILHIQLLIFTSIGKYKNEQTLEHVILIPYVPVTFI